ncbi:uncharacterized protein LOC143846468 isoform X2 [Tasmannia lanceolata]|uniref:uncharacterized protein LOC143846468 isoform X2 n=1 Tax=Tasmannia lanceolata TaxID=3420 RepID=UPI0040635BEA
MGGESGKKMKMLCLHGFRTSGSFFHKQISKWDPSIFAQFHMDFTEYTNLDECISYLCEYITSNGPFDGFIGFSQGATLSALLLGYQAQGKVLKDHPPMKLFVSVSGSKFRDPKICEVAYKDPIKVSSVHFIGAKDWLRLPSEELATAFENPLIIRHPQGHTVPRLDEAAVEQLKSWTMSILQSNVMDAEHCTESGEAGAAVVKPEESCEKKNVTQENGQCVENGHTGVVEVKTEEACESKTMVQDPVQLMT